jgi:hypothetical protein
MRKKKATRAKKTIRLKKKTTTRKKTLVRKKTTNRKKAIRRPKSRSRKIEFVNEDEVEKEVFETVAAGQSGDTQGLSRHPEGDSESVEELVEEGQAFEAGVVEGVENASKADEAEVTTKEVSEDDVPLEYGDKD